MEIITTHINADFDGLASMVAAKKLYPKATLVFAGSTGRPLRDFLSQDIRNLYGFKKIKHIDLASVTRLIVVDTRQAKRLGPLEECLENQGVEIHLYDHHPDAPGDMEGDVEHIQAVGSTTAIFVALLRAQGMTLFPDEATLLSLGLHEDTGSFLYATTTPADLQAAAWLLEQGADLDVVNQFITKDLSAEQIPLLSLLLENAMTYTVHSVSITVSRLTLPAYVDDFAVLVRRMMIMENLDALFSLVCMGERLYLICRSRIPEVNVGIIAREMGGGGHAAASSATIRDKTLFEAEEELLYLLHRHVKPRAMAGELMSSPVITATPEITHNQANDLLARYNINVLPVVRDNTDRKNPTGLLGIISRRDITKAIAHKLGDMPISEYMTTDLAVLPESATQADIQELIIENRQRLLPIVRDNIREDIPKNAQGEKSEQGTCAVICGVITRTDLLNLLLNDPGHLPRDLFHEDEHPSSERTRNISSLMTDTLSRDIIFLLREIGEIAQDLCMQAYTVGGFARDLLLQTKNLDIDIVVEGDGVLFAKELAARKQATVRTHEKFVTATVMLADGMRIDVATARLEYYAFPAAMPTVENSSLKQDLFRRDFTINALAIHLNPERFGTLVDFFNSQNDLKERRIRVLHNLSFVEDPTRIFRAVRFEQRLDFKISRHSEKLMRNAVRMHMYEKFSGPRFFSELKLILGEDHPLASLRRLDSFSLFPVLWPDLRPNLKIDRRFVHILTQTEKTISWFKLLFLEDAGEQSTRCKTWMVCLLAVFSRSREQELRNFCQRFELPPKHRRQLLLQKRKADHIALHMLRRPTAQHAEIYWLLDSLENEGLLYLMSIARKKHIRQQVSHYVSHLRGVQPFLSGQDLMELGYTPGASFRMMINYTLSARLNGEISSKEEAISLIQQKYPVDSPSF
ncbi:tRNA nucleotidyltransferase (CCA-adding enzyme) [Candidatus Electrothrix aarhusensis]|uniref:tRNA nucleotidyltransferase (CCA-adding enzyme) n=1 Tax=Candidatus Electrothrix aarhusensis TaxID=1859131 RepID=A0A444IR64_9BACT|nr:tRNA nucleotidyltransferase (CCA-adding enzyme) [Candidatus Electrothrix aarhusensis]